MVEETTKACGECGDTFPLSGFNRDRNKADGHQTRCRACHLAGVRKWRADHPEQVKASARDWKKANPDKVRASRLKSRPPAAKMARAVKAKYVAKKCQRGHTFLDTDTTYNPHRLCAQCGVEAAKRGLVSAPHEREIWPSLKRDGTPERVGPWLCGKPDCTSCGVVPARAALKVCKGCGIAKDLDDFHLSTRDGRSSQCKECKMITNHKRIADRKAAS